jgi:hypothetical protein
MARGSTDAQGAATAAQGISNQASGNAGALYSTVAPALETEMAHPAGFDPTTEAAMNTGAQQSAGGSQGAAVGQGALLAARTKNAGTADAAIGQSSRSAGEKLSKGLLATQMANAHLKAQQQQEATEGLENLYNTNEGASVGALGQVANNVNANTNASNASWDWAKYILDPAMEDASSGAAMAIKP